MMNIREKLNLTDEIKANNEQHVKDWKEGQKMFKVIMTAGTVKKDMFTNLTHKQAVEICEDYGWEVSPDGPGGFVWDLEIEEE